MGKKPKIIEVSGATEITPRLGLSDVVVDITSSGSTLKSNKLRIIDKIAKLIDVKSLITLAFGIAFIVFTYMQITTGEQFYNILMIIISFYFGTQVAKGNNDKK